MKLVFVDAEFTGEHIDTTLVSVGLVTLEGDSLGVSFNDYERDQVTEWFRENVLSLIDESKSVSSKEGCCVIASFLEEYSQGEPISLVSAGKLNDVLLLWKLWHTQHPERKYFHHLDCLPDYLNHAAHYDLNTLFFVAGIDPDTDREQFAGKEIEGDRHDSLHDAKVVRECFLRLVNEGCLPTIAERLCCGES